MSKLLLGIRGNFFVPDARVSWVKPSIVFLESVLKKEAIEAVITTGPPHSLHLIGYGLKKRHHIKWLADFRDPWTSIHYHDKMMMFPWVKAKHKKLEAKIVKAADKITVTSPGTQKEFEAIRGSKVHCITNGFDMDINTTQSLDTQFTITHIGSLLSERNPILLWEVLAELCQNEAGFSEDLKLQLVGATDTSIVQQIKDYKLEKQLLLVDYLSHDKAVKYQQKSQLLLLIESNREKVAQILPGKLFEYLAANRPILAIGPKNWDAKELIEKTKSGIVYTYSDKNKLKKDILEQYNRFKSSSLRIEPVDINAFHRKSLTEDLSKLLWEL